MLVGFALLALLLFFRFHFINFDACIKGALDISRCYFPYCFLRGY